MRCLLIGEGAARLRKDLAALSVPAFCGEWREDLLADMQRAFYGVQKGANRACVAAEGEMWAAALALAVQLSVDRVVLINPSGSVQLDLNRRRQLNRLKGYVKRNLFFCVSDVLVIESCQSFGQDMDSIFRRMVNARVWRVRTDGLDSAVHAAVHFLSCEDFAGTEYVCE